MRIPVNLGYSATKGNAGLCTWRGGHNIIINLRDTGVRVGTFLHEITHGVQYCAGHSTVSETLAYGVGDEVNLQVASGAPKDKRYYKLSDSFMRPITNVKGWMENLRTQMHKRIQQNLQLEKQKQEQKKDNPQPKEMSQKTQLQPAKTKQYYQSQPRFHFFR